MEARLKLYTLPVNPIAPYCAHPSVSPRPGAPMGRRRRASLAHVDTNVLTLGTETPPPTPRRAVAYHNAETMPPFNDDPSEKPRGGEVNGGSPSWEETPRGVRRVVPIAHVDPARGLRRAPSAACTARQITVVGLPDPHASNEEARRKGLRCASSENPATKPCDVALAMEMPRDGQRTPRGPQSLPALEKLRCRVRDHLAQRRGGAKAFFLLLLKGLVGTYVGVAAPSPFSAELRVSHLAEQLSAFSGTPVSVGEVNWLVWGEQPPKPTVTYVEFLEAFGDCIPSSVAASRF